jgi:hypothetical protein
LGSGDDSELDQYENFENEEKALDWAANFFTTIRFYDI